MDEPTYWTIARWRFNYGNITCRAQSDRCWLAKYTWCEISNAQQHKKINKKIKLAAYITTQHIFYSYIIYSSGSLIFCKLYRISQHWQFFKLTKLKATKLLTWWAVNMLHWASGFIFLQIINQLINNIAVEDMLCSNICC
jgi:hypothetical protein